MNQLRISSSSIIKLKDDEIFVFGSNLAAYHRAGAALYAVRKFGAIMGKDGLVGQTYGIPTKDRNIQTLAINRINLHVRKFILIAKKNPNLTFLVTEIGCGLAGYKPKDIAPLFAEAIEVKNIYLPKSFIEIIVYGS